MKNININFEELMTYLREDENFYINIGNWDNADYFIKPDPSAEYIDFHDEENEEFNVIFFPAYYHEFIDDDEYMFEILEIDFMSENNQLNDYDYNITLVKSDEKQIGEK